MGLQETKANFQILLCLLFVLCFSMCVDTLLKSDPLSSVIVSLSYSRHVPHGVFDSLYAFQWRSTSQAISPIILLGLSQNCSIHPSPLSLFSRLPFTFALIIPFFFSPFLFLQVSSNLVASQLCGQQNSKIVLFYFSL